MYSIPPANRKPNRISSMRAATRTGMTFVGPPMGQQTRQPKSDFVPRVIKPNPAVRQAREAFGNAYQYLIEQIETLATEAVDEEEAAYWSRELERIRKRAG